jgi:hypothetical protein
VHVRAIVRSATKVPPHLRDRPGVELIEASLLSLSDAELQAHLRGVDAVISCLGHVLSVAGIFGPPRDLVTQAMTRVAHAARENRAGKPTRVILMTSVSVNRPRDLDTRRGALERALIAVLCALVPPARDNQAAADFLVEQVGTRDPQIEWVVIRPDSLLAGDAGEYVVHEGLVDSLFSPGHTTMQNIGGFMAELVTDDATWSKWRGKLPVIVDAPAPDAGARTEAIVSASTTP